MRAARLHPSGGFGIADELKKPAQEREAITPPKAKSGGMRRQGVREGPGIVVHGAHGVGNHVGYCLRILPVVKEVRGNSGRSGHREPAQRDPLVLIHGSLMEAHVAPAGLPPPRQGEVVAVLREMAEAVKGRRGPVRGDALFRCALPTGKFGSELEPGGTEVNVIRHWRAGQVVYAVGHTLQYALGCQALQGGPREAGQLGLAPGYEPPLVLGNLGEAAESGIPFHDCILAHI